MTGKTLLHYEIHEKLGQGGMGEVYRAKDTKLGRDVALKILPADVASDAERLARFDREAKLLATLNHTHIASIYGLEQSDGTRFLVLEMVEGEDLAERIARTGALPVDEALEIARQVADALEVAHDADIVHRDLKPANIKVNPKGDVKVLDFGLGKAMQATDDNRNLSQSPTIMSSGTQAGVILGTAAYMSPEQARGRVVDKRTDVWAFGCVLWEMLTGTQLFQGETVSDTLAAVLRAEPEWDTLPNDTPPPIRRLLRRCLEKDAKRRLHSMADARIEIEDALADPEGTADVAAGATGGAAGGASGGMSGASTDGAYADASQARGHAQGGLARGKRPSPAALIISAVVIAIAGAAAGFFLRPAPPKPETLVRRVGIEVPPLPRSFGGVAISPDGSTVVTQALDPVRIIVRPLDRYSYRTLPESDLGANPFFSPDGQWIGFFNEVNLVRANVSGSSVHQVCRISGRTCRGTWGPNDTIVFSSFSASGEQCLYRVRVAGGEPELLLEPDLDKGERALSDPCFLPDGKGILFTIRTVSSSEIAVLDFKTHEKKILAADAASPRYAASGQVLYNHTRGIELLAASFDLATLEIRGEPVSVIEDGVQPGQYDVSKEGTLAYFSAEGLLVENSVVMIGRGDAEKTLIEGGGTWAQPRVSPDGMRLLIRQIDIHCVLWSYDLGRQTLTRLTFEGDCHDPLWSPDGRHMTFSSEVTTVRSIYEMPADGSGEQTLLVQGAGPENPGSWSPDGKFLVYEERGPLTATDLYVYSRETGESAVFLKTEFGEGLGSFSGDGRWIAYVSNESGRDEVYVRPFPGPGGKVQISREGGSSPKWAPDAGTLFYVSNAGLMKVTVTPGERFTASTPELFFGGSADFARVDLALTNFLLDRPNNYDVTPDGETLVVVKQPAGEGPVGDELRVVTNWFEELKRVVPVE